MFKELKTSQSFGPLFQAMKDITYEFLNLQKRALILIVHKLDKNI